MILAGLVLDRARSQIGKGTIYALGRGGMHPEWERCTDKQGRCDCSGFIAWCLGVSRKTDHPFYVEQNGGWLETSAIVKDCGSTLGSFDLARGVAPGMLMVWGDAGGKQGHIGIVSEVQDGQPHRVIHCSKGNYVDWHDAIKETSPELFIAHNAITARCGFVEYIG